MSTNEITAAEALDTASGNTLTGARFADENEAWASDAWRVLRESAISGMTCQLCGGSAVLVTSSRWDGERVCK